MHYFKSFFKIFYRDFNTTEVFNGLTTYTLEIILSIALYKLLSSSSSRVANSKMSFVVKLTRDNKSFSLVPDVAAIKLFFLSLEVTLSAARASGLIVVTPQFYFRLLDKLISYMIKNGLLFYKQGVHFYYTVRLYNLTYFFILLSLSKSNSFAYKLHLFSNSNSGM